MSDSLERTNERTFKKDDDAAGEFSLSCCCASFRGTFDKFFNNEKNLIEHTKNQKKNEFFLRKVMMKSLFFLFLE